MWNAATNADNCGFSQQPAARLSSICAILISKQLMTRGGSSTGNVGINIYIFNHFCHISQNILNYLLLITNK